MGRQSSLLSIGDRLVDQGLGPPELASVDVEGGHVVVGGHCSGRVVAVELDAECLLYLVDSRELSDLGEGTPACHEGLAVGGGIADRLGDGQRVVHQVERLFFPPPQLELGGHRVQHLGYRDARRESFDQAAGPLGVFVCPGGVAPVPFVRREGGECLGLPLPVACDGEGIHSRPVEGVRLVDRLELEDALFEERPPSFGVARRHGDRLPVELESSCRVERLCPLGCLHEEAVGAALPLRIVGRAKLVGGDQVVGDQFRDVCDPIAAHGLQPAGSCLVEPGPLVARESTVCDVADQDVGEGVLVLSLHRGAPHRSYQLALNQPAQALGEVGRRPGERQSSRPEDLSNDRGNLQDGGIVRIEEIDPGGDDCLDGIGKRQGLSSSKLLEPTPLSGQCYILGDIQRVAPGVRQQRLLGLGRHHHPAAEGCHQRLRVVVVERRQGDCGSVALAASPLGAGREQLGTSGGHQQDGDVVGPVQEVLEEVGDGVVRPVEVLDHQHQRVSPGEGFEEPQPGGEQLCAGNVLGPSGTRQRTEAHPDPLGLGVVVDQAFNRLAQLGCSRLRWLRLEDACLSLDDLPDRPEGHALAVWQAPALAPPHQVGTVVDRPAELPDQTALAHPGFARNGDELGGATGDRPFEGVDQQAQLLRSAHERCRRFLLDRHPEPAAGGFRPPDRNRLCLALETDRVERIEVERRPARKVGSLVDHDLAGCGHGFQPGGGVDDVADDPLPVDGVFQLDDGLAGGDRRPHRKCQCGIRCVEVFHRLLDPERRAYRPLRIVFVGDGGPKHGEHSVAHELFDAAAEAFDVLTHPAVIGREPFPHVLWVGTLGVRREPGEVGEEHRDGPPLLGRRLLHRRWERCWRRPERCPTLCAELVPWLVGLAASAAGGDHSGSALGTELRTVGGFGPALATGERHGGRVPAPRVQLR